MSDVCPMPVCRPKKRRPPRILVRRRNRSRSRRSRSRKRSRSRSRKRSRSRSRRRSRKRSGSRKRRPRKRKASKEGGGKRCYRAGIVTRNPFFNFLRTYRQEHCGPSIIEIAKNGAKVWNSMSAEEKRKYIDQARHAPKMKRRRRRKRMIC